MLDAVLEAGPRPRHPAVRRGGADDAAHRGRARRSIDVEWHDSRLAFSDAERVTPKELGFGWMLRGVRDGVAPVRRHARRSAASSSTAPRGGRPPAIVVDWADWDRLLPRGRAASRRSPSTRCPTSRCSSTTTGDEVGYCTQLRLLAGPAAAHRHRPRPARPRGAPAPSCGSSSPSPTTTPRSGSRTTPMPFFDPAGRRTMRKRDEHPRVRRHRRRRRPQRADPRGVPRQGRAAHAGAGAPRRSSAAPRSPRSSMPGLLVHDVLLRAEPAAARDHPRARPGASTASCR